ncbi:PREDICTED: 26S proteasome non-ATPase regulatory subunit 4 [Papilio xuthus]|uniref:26S proteasome non-ATPase regulatory subunit 4 n=2 Tax=Papilio xuthus TaxID=66420 RepID=A0A194QAX9_PAPXU|nr:PREDICTED: 26S proteasome non-ATPase regulatory subunit 4 [Papilio xuthus]KPJ02622.1 26S proteasome non-ATPase regulatory subunit 4 [Papilio xuthus]
MVLESTMICVDNSDYMRNGDFLPTRLQAQQDAVNLVCHSRTRSNPENNVGLLTLANVEVLATLTSDVGRILSKLHRVQPNGNINLLTGIRIAHLALKHRQGKNHKMRIVVFVGSPINTDEKELVKLAKRLKKEKVNCDVISFGEDAENNPLLVSFINTLNGKDNASGGSHLVSVPAGGCVVLSEALISSPLIGGDGAGPSGSGLSPFEFGVDPNEDPELALALRVSMEEQRQRQEEETRRQQANTDTEMTEGNTGEAQNTGMERALAMSLGREAMELSEEEQIALAMEMSMQQEAPQAEESMDVPEEYAEVMNDPAFLQSVLENLPGVDPQSEAIRNAMSTIKKDKEEKDDKKQKDKDGKGGSSSKE